MAVKRKGPDSDQQLREGEWMCVSCNARNYSARVVCYKCPMTKQESEVRSKGKSALDWECFKCKSNNFSFRDACFRCNLSRRESDDIKAEREGVPWLCRFCNLENYSYRRDCFKCKERKEVADARPPPRRMMSPPRGMSPPGRGYYNRSPPRAYPRGRSPPPRGPMYPDRPRSPPPMFRGRSRSPPRRLLPSPPRRPVSPLNKATDEGGFHSSTPRDGRSAVHSRIGSLSTQDGNKRLKPGEWLCTKCDIVNFAKRKACFKCKGSKETLAASQDPEMSFSITINNTRESNISHNNSAAMGLDDLSSASKRPRLDYDRDHGPLRGAGPRGDWGPDWTCGFCIVDIPSKRNDCYKCGRMRGECEMRPEPRFDQRSDRYSGPPGRGLDSRFSPGPCDRFDRFDPPREGPAGYTCSCGNFNRILEPDCVKCGRPNDRRSRDHWLQGGPSRSPPRYYSNAPRALSPGRPGFSNRNNSKKEVVKYEPDWKCELCDFKNFAKRTSCRECKKKRAECEKKTADTTKSPVGGKKKEELDKKKKESKTLEQEWDGKPLSDVVAHYVGIWEDCLANPDRKIKEGEIEGRKMIKLKRIVKRNMVKAKKKDAEGEDAKKMEKEYTYLCLLHQKSFRDIKGSDLDWDCEKCAAYNWASRDKCFKCAALKPSEPSKDDEEAGTSASTEEAMPAEGENTEEKATDNPEENCVEVPEEPTNDSVGITEDKTAEKDNVNQPENNDGDVTRSEAADDSTNDLSSDQIPDWVHSI